MNSYQASLIAAHTGLMILIKDDLETYKKCIEKIAEREVAEDELKSLPQEIQDKAKKEYDQKYESYNKTELALIQSYTGVELLKNSDIKYLKRFEKFSDDNIKEKLFNICIQKEFADNRTLQDFEKLSKTKTYVSRILIAIVVLCIITAVICIILFGINIDSSSISDYIGIILVCIFGAAISSVLYGFL